MSETTGLKPASPKPTAPASGRPPGPDQSSGSGFLRQLVILIAIILTFCTAAFAGVWAVTSKGVTKSNSDKQLVELLVAAEMADRAFGTERDFGRTGTQMPEELVGQIDQAAQDLGTAAQAFGIKNLGLTDSPEDRQINLLLTDPAQRLADSRQEMVSGHVADTEDLASFDNMQLAIRELATKAPALMQTPRLTHLAETYAEKAGSNNPWPLSATPPPDNDPRQGPLNLLVEAEQADRDRASTAPTIFMWVAIALAVLAVGAWALLLMGKNSWAKAQPKTPREPKQAKAPKEPKARKEKAPKAPKPPKAAKEKSPKAPPKGTAPGAAPAAAPGAKPATPAISPGAKDAAPAATPGAKPASPAATPGAKPATPANTPGAKPATPGATPGAKPATTPGAKPVGSASLGARPAASSTLGAKPIAAGTPGARPATTPGAKPATPATAAPKPAGVPTFGATTAPVDPGKTSPPAPSPEAKPAGTTKPAPAAKKPADSAKPSSGPRIPWRTTGDGGNN